MVVFRMFFNADKFIWNFTQFKTSAKRRHLEFGIFYECEVLYVTLTEELVRLPKLKGFIVDKSGPFSTT